MDVIIVFDVTPMGPEQMFVAEALSCVPLMTHGIRPASSWKAKYPTCGISTQHHSSRGTTTGKEAGRISSQKAWRSHVCPVLKEDGHQRFNASPPGTRRSKHHVEN